MSNHTDFFYKKRSCAVLAINNPQRTLLCNTKNTCFRGLVRTKLNWKLNLKSKFHWFSMSVAFLDLVLCKTV